MLAKLVISEKAKELLDYAQKYGGIRTIKIEDNQIWVIYADENFRQYVLNNRYQQENNELRQEIVAVRDKLHRRNDLIRNKVKRIKELEEKIQAYRTILKYSQTNYNEETVKAGKIINR